MAEVGRLIELGHLVNAEYGLSDRNDYTDAFIKSLYPFASFEEDENGYLWYIVSTDDWGFKCLGVLSYYLYPDKRTASNFLKMQKKIEGIAKKEKVKYIEQGSHLNPKVNDILLKLGYKHAVLRKDL